MLPPSLHTAASQSSATVSAETSRCTCSPAHLLTSPAHLLTCTPAHLLTCTPVSRASSRASSVEEAENSADPDWDEEAEDTKEEVGTLGFLLFSLCIY